MRKATYSTNKGALASSTKVPITKKTSRPVKAKKVLIVDEALLGEVDDTLNKRDAMKKLDEVLSVLPLPNGRFIPVALPSSHAHEIDLDAPSDDMDSPVRDIDFEKTPASPVYCSNSRSYNLTCNNDSSICLFW